MKNLRDVITKEDSLSFIKLIHRISDSSVSNLMQELAGQIDENMGEHNNKVVKKAKDKIWDAQLASPINSLDATSIIFPDHTKFFWSTEEYCFIVLQYPPQSRYVKWNSSYAMKRKGREENRFLLAFPYTLFTASFAKVKNRWDFKGLHLAYTTKELTSFDDTLYRAALPNISNLNGHHCCLGSNFRVNSYDSISRQTTDAINFFWNGTISTDWQQNWQNQVDRDSTFGNLPLWERKSKQDASFVLKVDWGEGQKFRNWLQSVANHAGVKKFSPQLEIATDVAFTAIANILDSQWENIESKALVPAKEQFSELLDAQLVLHFEDALETIVEIMEDRLSKMPSGVRNQIRNMLYDTFGEAVKQAIKQV